jgi:hypothetical protein
MKTTTTSLSAIGVSPWIPVNYRQSPFSASVAVDLDSAASLITYTVEHTFDDFGAYRTGVSLSRSGTTVTAVYPTPHDLNTGDGIAVEMSSVAGLDGQFPVTVTNTTTLTYVSAVSGAATAESGVQVTNLRVFPKTNMSGKTTSAEDTYIAPVTGIRLNVTALTAGKATLIVNQGQNS